jgi:hypothetical protein
VTVIVTWERSQNKTVSGESAALHYERMTGIDYFAGTDIVHIATELTGGGEISTPIWAVVVDGVPYIRAGYGPGSKWYRRLQRTGRAVFTDGPHRYPATIDNVADEETLDKIDAAYRAKYARQTAGLAAIVAPPARAQTMRLVLS